MFADAKVYGECVTVKELTGKDKIALSKNMFKCEIQEVFPGENEITGKYYKVAVYVEFDIPLRKESIVIPISGETKIVQEYEEYEPKEATYYMVDEEFELPDIEEEKASGGGGGVAPPASGCCNSTVCSKGTMVLKNGKYQCRYYDKEGEIDYAATQCNASKPGRKMNSSGSACCYTCKGAPPVQHFNRIKKSGTTFGFQGNVFRYQYLNTTDPSNIGYACSNPIYGTICRDLLGHAMPQSAVYLDVQYKCIRSATLTVKTNYCSNTNKSATCPKNATREGSCSVKLSNKTCSASKMSINPMGKVIYQRMSCTCINGKPSVKSSQNIRVTNNCASTLVYYGSWTCTSYSCPQGGTLNIGTKNCEKHNQKDSYMPGWHCQLQ